MEAEFTIEYGALTAAEQDAFVALLNERTAHANEVLEARRPTADPAGAPRSARVERPARDHVGGGG
jgi:hypothetical protein